MERTLSQNEAKVILDLEWRGQKTVTLAEVRAALDATDEYARYVAHRLVKKGWLERLRPGLFQLVPAQRGREGVANTHPLTAGGIGEISRMVARGASRVAWERAIQFAKRWKQSAIVQRLGYLLDLHEAELPVPVRKQLLELVSPKSKVHLGSRRRWGAAGKLARPWNVIENVPADVLLEARDQGRRRVSFGTRSKKG